MRHTAKVKDLVKRMMRQGALWQDCGDGWQALETNIRLSGWTKERRVILVRENTAKTPVRETGKPCRGKDRQKLLPNVKGAGWDAQATPWSGKSAVLVTSLDELAFPTQVIPKHYRDRADAENCFDELKNQWGWNGFTSRKLASSRLLANLTALFYNWWNLYLRFYDEEHYREAIRSRPMLMAGVGRQAHRQSQRLARKKRSHRASCHAHQQRVKSHPRHHGAVERESTLDPASDPLVTALTGRKMVARPARRSATPAQRMKILRIATTRSQHPPHRSKAIR